MLGHSPRRNSAEIAPRAPLQEVVISLRGVEARYPSGARALHDVNMNVRKGEIVGIAALENAASPLLRILAGRSKPFLGSVTLPSEIDSSLRIDKPMLLYPSLHCTRRS